MSIVPDEIRALLPWQSHFFPYDDGAKIHYIDQGSRDAPSMVLVHGNPTWCFYFRSLIAHFSKSYRVIAMDFLGMGLSSKIDGPALRAIDRSQELDALLAHLGIGKFWMVMHDWGGPIGTRVAINRIEDLQGIVYLNTTLTETESLPPFIKLAAAGPFSKLITATTTQFLHFTTRLGSCTSLPRSVRDAYFLPFPTARSRKAVCDFVQDIPFSSEHPTHRDLAEMAAELPILNSKPVLILWGLKDPVFHRGMLKRVAAHFPHAKVIEYPDASHLLLEDKPQQVVQEIETFLNACSQSNVLEAALSPASLPSSTTFTQPNLVQSFFDNAKKLPDLPASIEVITAGILASWPLGGLLGNSSDSLRYDLLSFRDLRARTLQYQRGLLALGLSPGKKIVMLVSPGHDFLAFAFAIMACGAIPVFIDPGIGLSRLCTCISDAAADGCIVSARAQLLMLVKGKVFKGMSIIINASRLPIGFGTGLEFFSGFSAADTELPQFDGDASALVAFTSGATGTPKGVIFSNRMLASQLNIFSSDFGISAGKIDLPLLPIFSLYGASAGVGSVFYPTNPGRPLDLNPAHICKLIKDLGVETSFGSPTLWSKISNYAAGQALNLPSLKKIFMAGTSVSMQVIKTVSSVCPKAQIYTPYGATEALPITLARTETLPTVPKAAKNGMLGIAVGKPIDAVEAKIIEIVEGPIASFDKVKVLAAGEIGELIVRGSNVSNRYLNRIDANQNGKISDGSSTWHRVGDASYFGEDGNIYYCGRIVHRVKFMASDGQQRILYSEPAELVFNVNSKVRRSALISIGSLPQPAVAIEPHPEYLPRTEAEYHNFIAELRSLAAMYEFTKDISEFYFFPTFPVDARHNAKIFRDELGQLAAQGQSASSQWRRSA